MIDKSSKQYLAQQAFLQQQSDLFLKHSLERTSINIVWIGCSTTNLDDSPRRTPTSHEILSRCLDVAHKLWWEKNIEVNTRTHILEDIDFDHCEANYSMQWHYCTRPCWITQRKAEKWETDPLSSVYQDLIDRSDIVLVATPIRRWSASSLYYKLVERLNCIENQKEVYNVDLVHNKLMGMIIMWAQDGAQHVMGQMMSVWAELGFAFAKSPYVAYTAGWLLNDRIDLIPSQIKKDMPLIDSMIHDMLTEQFALITQRRK
jgi:multimeric flavodoxin WrbA